MLMFLGAFSCGAVLGLLSLLCVLEYFHTVILWL